MRRVLRNVDDAMREGPGHGSLLGYGIYTTQHNAAWPGPCPILSLPATVSYVFVPSGPAGNAVVAPVGRGVRPSIGYCVGVTGQAPTRTVKAIGQVLDDEPLLTPNLLKLTRWMADYYVCGWGQVLNAVV